MSHPLDGARAKIRRARRHLNILEEKIGPFRNRRSYRVTRKRDTKQGQLRFTWRAFRRKPFPQEHVALLIGEVLHNCRCVLDYLTWELAERHNGGNSKTQFPIYDTRPQDRNGQLIPWSTLASIAPIDGRAQTLIERLQPYRRTNPTSDALWLLHALNNTDKHKLLIASTGMVKGQAFRYEPPGLRVRRGGTVYRGPFEDGAVIAEIIITQTTDFAGGETKAKVRVKGDFTFDVTFSGRPIPPDTWVLVIPMLTRIISRVERVTNLIDGFMQRTYGLPPSRR